MISSSDMLDVASGRSNDRQKQGDFRETGEDFEQKLAGTSWARR